MNQLKLTILKRGILLVLRPLIQSTVTLGTGVDTNNGCNVGGTLDTPVPEIGHHFLEVGEIDITSCKGAEVVLSDD